LEGSGLAFSVIFAEELSLYFKAGHGGESV
jgi:hypothetical protein